MSVIERARCLWLASALSALAVTPMACGGEAKSGGEGTSSSSSSSSGAPPSAAVCADLCGKLVTNACAAAPQDCAAFCAGQLADSGICEDELGQLYACWLPVAPPCPDMPPPECKAEEDTFEACVAAYGCAPAECTGSTGPNGVTECGCSQSCASTSYVTSCVVGATKTSCECFVNAASVGTCEGGGDRACEINAGCCAALFMK